MKIGINGTGLVQKANTAAVLDHAKQAARDGFSSYWLAEHPTGGFDALTVLAAVGPQVPELEFGTAIVPSMPRHPMVLAGQAQTAVNLMPGRLTLGIGMSHATMMDQLGIPFDKPIRHLREYLNILMPLLREGEVDYSGETLSCQGKFFQTPTNQVPVMVAALGPQALAVTGRLADGTTLAWVGPKTIRDHIVPRISEAANAAGRESPRIIATLPVCVTEQPEVVRAAIGKGLSMYAKLPSYQAMFEREGVAGPAELAVVGSAAEVADSVASLREAGVTDFAASEFYLNGEERGQTREFLKGLVA